MLGKNGKKFRCDRFLHAFCIKADKVLRSVLPAADGKPYLIGDTTHKPKRGKQHPLGHVMRQSKSSPHFFGFGMVMLVASWNGFRIPIQIATIDPERKGYQNILFRQMLNLGVWSWS